MALANVKIEGAAEFGLIETICVCAFCNNHDSTVGTLEFNFKEQKVYYVCSKCKKMNEINFGGQKATPLPRSKFAR